jgi:hypothetical protein
VECRASGGTGGDHTLVITFSNNVVSGNATVTAGSGGVAGTPTFTGNTMTINLTGVGNAQKITVRLTNVIDSFSQVLPNIEVSMNLLFGDTTGNKTVNTTDIAQVKADSGLVVNASRFRTDVNVNGTLTTSDISAVKSAAGTSVP